MPSSADLSEAVDPLRVRSWRHEQPGRVIIQHTRSIAAGDEVRLQVAINAYVAALAPQPPEAA
jgi:hypothetical protein